MLSRLVNGRLGLIVYCGSVLWLLTDLLALSEKFVCCA